MAALQVFWSRVSRRKLSHPGPGLVGLLLFVLFGLVLFCCCSSLGLGCFSRLTLFELVGAAPAGPGHFRRKCLEAPGRLASLLLLLLVGLCLVAPGCR